MPERLRTFDLVASLQLTRAVNTVERLTHQIKKIHLCDLSDSAVKAIYHLLTSGRLPSPVSAAVTTTGEAPSF